MENKSIKILYVDDERNITTMSSIILSDLGYTTFTALDGEEALAIFKKEHPHLTIIDVYLGVNSRIDGIELLAKIKEMDKEAACLIISRVTDAQTRIKAEELGVNEDCYLNKSEASQIWLNKVQEMVEHLKEKETSHG